MCKAIELSQFLNKLCESKNSRILQYVPEKLFKRIDKMAQHKKEQRNMQRGSDMLEMFRKPIGKLESDY